MIGRPLMLLAVAALLAPSTVAGTSDGDAMHSSTLGILSATGDTAQRAVAAQQGRDLWYVFGDGNVPGSIPCHGGSLVQSWLLVAGQEAVLVEVRTFERWQPGAAALAGMSQEVLDGPVFGFRATEETYGLIERAATKGLPEAWVFYRQACVADTMETVVAEGIGFFLVTP